MLLKSNGGGAGAVIFNDYGRLQPLKIGIMGEEMVYWSKEPQTLLKNLIQDRIGRGVH